MGQQGWYWWAVVEDALGCGAGVEDVLGPPRAVDVTHGLLTGGGCHMASAQGADLGFAGTVVPAASHWQTAGRLLTDPDAPGVWPAASSRPFTGGRHPTALPIVLTWLMIPWLPCTACPRLPHTEVRGLQTGRPAVGRHVGWLGHGPVFVGSSVSLLLPSPPLRSQAAVRSEWTRHGATGQAKAVTAIAKERHPVAKPPTAFSFGAGLQVFRKLTGGPPSLASITVQARPGKRVPLPLGQYGSASQKYTEMQRGLWQ